jgi:DNA replication protein DnaC
VDGHRRQRASPRQHQAAADRIVPGGKVPPQAAADPAIRHRPHAACEAGFRVRFTTAIDIVNTLSAADKAGRFVQELKKYTRPDLLVCDELGYLPIDKRGADLLFQIISHRYERGAIVLTTNKVFKHWPSIFNNDSTLTSAILDRLLYHAETIVIEGKSYRMKDRIEP